jgi:hypothetical protein
MQQPVATSYRAKNKATDFKKLIQQACSSTQQPKKKPEQVQPVQPV